jgi:signal transduction histidine kinase
MKTPVRLLFIEDDAVDREAFRRMVADKQLPYGLTIAETLSEARAQLREKQFDVIIADYHLPDGNSTELFEDAPDTPFIVLTGTLREELALRTLRRGADDYLGKDPEQRHLEAIAITVEKALHRQRFRDIERQLTQQLRDTVDERTAKLQEMVAELEHFSYTITHDMRAPLRAMRGLAKLLVEDCAPCLQREHREYLHRISDSAERMDHLIADALQYSLLVRGQFHLEPVDADALIRGLLESYPEFQPPQAHVRISNPLPVVLANKAGLTQCFSNLLGNAVKFVRPGQTPDVLVRAEETQDGPREPKAPATQNPRQSDEGSSPLSSWHMPEKTTSETANDGVPPAQPVRIWFEDNGIGIDKEYQDKIWVMFQRLNKSYPGTGIGLALVRKAVERMGGRVGLESEPGHGSRFWIELQLANGSPNPNHSKETAHNE